MKRIMTLGLTLALALSLAACSNGGDSAVTPEQDTDVEVVEKDYAGIIADVREEEYNEAFMIISSTDGTLEAIHGYSAEYDEEMLASEVNDILSPVLGFDFALAENYALSVSAIMTHSYGVAIFMPAEGNTDAIVAGLEAFVENQRLAFQNYLPDQYEIASAATVTVADSGEVILVCSANGAQMLSDIEAALAA